MNKREERELELYIPPKNYTGTKDYPYNIRYCPQYTGYKPDNLSHEVCKYCGHISYQH